MKLIIAGSRHFTSIDKYDLKRFIDFFKLGNITEIVAGGCPTGPDNAAFWYARNNGIKFKEFPADWKKHGKIAGPIRNEEMANYADALLLIWDGKSKGSRNMFMKMIGKPTYEVILR